MVGGNSRWENGKRGLVKVVLMENGQKGKGGWTGGPGIELEKSEGW